MKITIHTQKPKNKLGDLFGIFFEDINHAADGGLYGQLLQNGAFEFSPLDNAQYRALTAWEKIEEAGEVEWSVACHDPVSRANPHYLSVAVVKQGRRTGVRNLGFQGGIPLTGGSEYNFSCYARTCKPGSNVRVVLTDGKGKELCSGTIFPGEKWGVHTLTLTPAWTEYGARLELLLQQQAELDFISLFPRETFLGRERGMRRDIARMLAALTPKFMRFPGGCLVHDGSLQTGERDSLYRWKNTVGDVTARAARRNNWNYNQTLGLGYYEYFQFCEDIGAKALPVLPAGHNPHAGRQSTPMAEMQPWIDDALDLIEFAKGDAQSTWGSLRARMGHPAPFVLEYLGIGNEEVSPEFFRRYRVMHQAIRAVYPEIKLINSAGPFCAGEAYRLGWASARENGSDLIDEHYYQAPDWFIENHDRYADFTEQTKVFVGEYAAKSNTWYSALAEAVFMIGLEKSAHAVGLACYAPLLCNANYVNWQPDLIWFDNHRVYGTANYYVQKLFMNHQGAYSLPCTPALLLQKQPAEIQTGNSFSGELCLAGNKSRVAFTHIFLENLETGEVLHLPDGYAEIDGQYKLSKIDWHRFSLKCTARQFGPGWGFELLFGMQDQENHYGISLGGWENQDAFFTGKKNGLVTTYTQKSFHVQSEKLYELELQVLGEHIAVLVDGKTLLTGSKEVRAVESMYYTASKDGNGDIIVKLANVLETSQEVNLVLEGVSKATGTAYVMEGFDPTAQNSFEAPEKVIPTGFPVKTENGVLCTMLAPLSLQVIRLTPVVE